MQSTRISLLERLRDTSADGAWEEFYATYWAVVIRYAQKLGLNENSCHDVLQETMVALMRVLPGFTYDRERGRFRNLLLTITHRKALGAFRRTARNKEVSIDAPATEDGLALIDRLSAPADESVGDEDGRRWKESIFEEALSRVRRDPDVKPGTFEVFRAYAIENRPCEEVALEFGMKANAVYQIKNRLMKRLAAEVRHLVAADPGKED